MFEKEQRYIAKRKVKAMGSKLCFWVCRIFPIKRNRITVCTFEGKGGFGCNPKYIVQELYKRNPNYEFIWFVNDMNKEFPDYIKKVPNTLWNRAYWLSTSKVWIDNYRKPYGTCKRRKQYYINTWHATIGFKSIGLWRGSEFSKMAYIVSKNDSEMIDRVTIDSEWCAEMYPRGMIYDKEFLWSGAPRCDVLYGDRTVWKDIFHKKCNHSLDVKYVMYAPTFREKSVNGRRTVFSETWTLDFNRMLENLGRKFDGEWKLCLRVHPQLAEKIHEYANEELKGKVIDVSKADDMYEILAAMDAFVTDYSSAAMDAGFTHMPVFIYADDIENYLNDRGSMLWNLSGDSYVDVKNNKLMTPNIDTVLPYPIAQNNEELEKQILEFDRDRYMQKLKDFEKNVKLVFDGKASERTADCVEQFMQN